MHHTVMIIVILLFHIWYEMYVLNDAKPNEEENDFPIIILYVYH